MLGVGATLQLGMQCTALSSSLGVGCCTLVVGGSWLTVVDGSCWLVVAGGCWMLVPVGCWWLAGGGCWLVLAGGCWWLVAVGWWLLLLAVGGCSWLGDCWRLLAVKSWWLAPSSADTTGPSFSGPSFSDVGTSGTPFAPSISAGAPAGGAWTSAGVVVSFAGTCGASFAASRRRASVTIESSKIRSPSGS